MSRRCVLMSLRTAFKRKIEITGVILSSLFGRRERDVQKPALIGARNPYAVYRAKHHTNPFPGLTPEEARSELCNLGGSDLDYTCLFDPGMGSCLFCKSTIEAVRPHAIHIEANRESVTSMGGGPERENNGGTPTTLLQGAPGNIADCQQSFQTASWLLKHPGDPTDPGCLYWPWFPDPRTSPRTKKRYPSEVSPSFLDPVQGPIPDCYLLASLSSIAWFGALNYKIILSDSAEYDVGLLDLDKGLVEISGKKTSGKVPTDFSLVFNPSTPHDEQPVGAKTRSLEVSWVPYYEKAYCRYLEYIEKITPSPNGDNPEICRIPCGDASQTLRALMKKSSNFLDLYSMQGKPLGSPERDPVNVWAELREFCETFHPAISPAPGTPNAWKTVYPVVAWTNTTGDPDITGLSDESAAPRGSGVNYLDEILCAAHAYSLLGLHRSVYNEVTENYVILRNPWVECWGFDYNNANPLYHLSGRRNPDGTNPGAKLIFGSIKNRENKPYEIPLFYQETIQGQQVTRPRDGIFALKLEDFANWFAGFSRVIA